MALDDGSCSTRLREYELDGDVTVYDPDSQQAIVLNSTAAVVWGLADGSHAEGEIVQSVARTFQQVPADIAGVVRDLLDQLQNLSLLERRDPPQRRS